MEQRATSAYHVLHISLNERWHPQRASEFRPGNQREEEAPVPTAQRSLPDILVATPLRARLVLPIPHRAAKHRPQELRARLLPKCRLRELGKAVAFKIAFRLGFNSLEVSCFMMLVCRCRRLFSFAPAPSFLAKANFSCLAAYYKRLFL